MLSGETIDTSMTAPPKSDLRHARWQRTHSRILGACRSAMKAGDFRPTVSTIGRISNAAARTIWCHFPRVDDLYREALDDETRRAIVALIIRDAAGFVFKADAERLVAAVVYGRV